MRLSIWKRHEIRPEEAKQLAKSRRLDDLIDVFLKLSPLTRTVSARYMK